MARSKLTESGKEKVKEALLRKGLKIEAEAKRLAPVDTGRLRSSITTELDETGSGIKVRVGTNVEYAPYIEFGTEPYTIKPDDAEALKWTGEDGEPVFASKVEHPGIPAQPFLFPAVDKVRNQNR